MTPVQCLARIAAIIPPPRFPLLRFAGVLAPSSSWRSAVVAMRPALANGVELPPTTTRNVKKKPSTSTSWAAAAPDVAPVRDETPPPPPSEPQTSLGAGVVPSCYARIDWATLLRRVYLDDVLSCPCGGRRYVVAALPHEPRNERDAVVAIHTHLWVCSRHSALRACLIACASLASSMPAHAPCVKEFSPRKTTSSTRQHVRRRKHGLIGFSGRASGVCLIPACVTARP